MIYHLPICELNPQRAHTPLKSDIITGHTLKTLNFFLQIFKIMFIGRDKPICSTIFYFLTFFANLKVEKLKLVIYFLLIRFSVLKFINNENLMVLLLKRPL